MQEQIGKTKDNSALFGIAMSALEIAEQLGESDEDAAFWDEDSEPGAHLLAFSTAAEKIRDEKMRFDLIKRALSGPLADTERVSCVYLKARLADVCEIIQDERLLALMIVDLQKYLSPDYKLYLDHKLYKKVKPYFRSGNINKHWPKTRDLVYILLDKIKDQSIHMEIAAPENSGFYDERVASAAVKRINEQDFLVDAVRNHSSHIVRSSALRNVSDIEKLGSLALSLANSLLIDDAIRQIGNACNRRNIVKAIGILAGLAANATESRYRDIAISNIAFCAGKTENMAFLRDSDPTSAENAAKSLLPGETKAINRELLLSCIFKDVKLLERYAREDDDYFCRIIASYRLYSGRKKTGIVYVETNLTTDGFGLSRYLAEKWLIDNRPDDLPLMRDILRHSNENDLCLSALGLLPEYSESRGAAEDATPVCADNRRVLSDSEIREVLSDCAQSFPPHMCIRAIEMMNRPEITCMSALADIAKAGSRTLRKHGRYAAEWRAKQKPHDRNAKKSMRKLYIYAAERLTDQDLLKEVFAESKDHEVRMIVLDRITDVQFLRKYHHQKPVQMRLAALKKEVKT